MADEKEITYVRLEPEVKRALSRLAEIDGRSLSALLSKIASGWVKAHQPAKGERHIVTDDMVERIRKAQTGTKPAKEQRRP